MNKTDDTLPAGEGENEEAKGALAPSLDMLIDEHEEEVSVDGKTVRHRGIFLLPNLITTAGLFCGFYAIVASMRGDFESAAIAIFFAAQPGRVHLGLAMGTMGSLVAAGRIVQGTLAFGVTIPDAVTIQRGTTRQSHELIALHGI